MYVSPKQIRRICHLMVDNEKSNAHSSSQSSPTAGRARGHSDSLASESSIHATSEKLQEPPHPSQNVDKQLETANQEIKKLKLELDEKTRQIANLQSEQKQLTDKKDMKKLKDKDLRKQYQAALDEKERLEEKLKKEKKEKEEVLLRLSAEAATKLTHNNPQVTDLSDENRATKLSEKFSELYDNQWTDAFEALVKDGKHSDRDAINILLSALLKISDTCVGKSKQDMQRLKDIILEFGGDDKEGAVSKGLLERRKHRFGHTLQELTESIQENLDANGKVAFTASPAYINNCIKLCWLMAIQDPPLHIGRPDTQKNGLFDKSLFKSYTKDGDEIDYVVWPALFLHHDGPLLCKGVAQAKDKENIVLNTTAEDPVRPIAEVKDQTPPNESTTKVEESDIKNQDPTTKQNLLHRRYEKNNQTTEELAEIDENDRLVSEGRSVENVVQTKENADEPQNRSPATSTKEEHQNPLIGVDPGAKQDLASKLHDEENQVQEQVEQTTTNKQNEANEQPTQSPIQNQDTDVRGVDDVSDTEDTKNQESEQAVETVAAVDEIELRTETLENHYNEMHVVADTIENTNENLTSVKGKDENTDHSVGQLDVSQDEKQSQNISLKEEASTTSQPNMVSSSEHGNEHGKQLIPSSNNDGENNENSSDILNYSPVEKLKNIEDNQNEAAEKDQHNLNASIPNQPSAVGGEPTNKTENQTNDNVIKDQKKCSSTYLEKRSLNKAGDSGSKSTREQSTNKQSKVSQDSSQTSTPERTPSVTRAGINKLNTDKKIGKDNEHAWKQDRPLPSKQNDENKSDIRIAGANDNKKLPTIPPPNRSNVDNKGKSFNVISKTHSGASTESDTNRNSTNSRKLDIPITGTKTGSPWRAQGRTASVVNAPGLTIEPTKNSNDEKMPKVDIKALLNKFSS